MLSGSWHGTAYAFDGAFDPVFIPRIRSQGRRGPDASYGSTAWLDRLAERPVTRYAL